MLAFAWRSRPDVRLATSPWPDGKCASTSESSAAAAGAAAAGAVADASGADFRRETQKDRRCCSSRRRDCYSAESHCPVAVAAGVDVVDDADAADDAVDAADAVDVADDAAAAAGGGGDQLQVHPSLPAIQYRIRHRQN